jgi:hypothetical protein
MGQLINGKRSRAVCFEGKENGSNTLIEVNIWLDIFRRPSIAKAQNIYFYILSNRSFYSIEIQKEFEKKKYFQGVILNNKFLIANFVWLFLQHGYSYRIQESI